jgi:hypothetical protein
MLDKNINTNNNTEKLQIDWLKYINTLIITLIFGFTVMCFTSINSVKSVQSEQGKELVRLATIQSANVLAIVTLTTRVATIELNQTESIKNWVMANFVIKLQK